MGYEKNKMKAVFRRNKYESEDYRPVGQQRAEIIELYLLENDNLPGTVRKALIESLEQLDHSVYVRYMSNDLWFDGCDCTGEKTPTDLIWDEQKELWYCPKCNHKSTSYPQMKESQAQAAYEIAHDL